MQNHISLVPNQAVASYVRNFQIAQANFKLFMEEEKLIKRKPRFRHQPKKRHA